jgi:hypothetical protein
MPTKIQYLSGTQTLILMLLSSTSSDNSESLAIERARTEFDNRTKNARFDVLLSSDFLKDILLLTIERHGKNSSISLAQESEHTLLSSESSWKLLLLTTETIQTECESLISKETSFW